MRALLGTALAASACTACIPPPVAPTLPRIATVAPAPAPAQPEDVNAACASAFPGASTVLARVGAVALHACDVWDAQRRAVRQGLAVPDLETQLALLVDEALLANEAVARGLDRDPSVAHAVRDTLAAALVRDESRARSTSHVPDDDAVARYYAAHADEFSSPARVHLREVVCATERDALAVIADAATVPFDALASRTTGITGRRDDGDLGWVSPDGNAFVDASVARAGFALAADGDVASTPVHLVVAREFGRHHRVRRVHEWHVVQRLDRLEASVIPRESATDAIRARLASAAYEPVRRTVLSELRAGVRDPARHAVDDGALRTVRINEN